MNESASAEERVFDGLAKVPIFSALDDRSRRKLAKLCALKTFEAGDVILEEGAIGLSVFIVTSGQAERFKSRDGAKVCLGRVEPGGVLGEVALLDDRPRSTSAAALEPTECLLLTRDSLETLIKKEPRIAWCLVPGLAGRVRDLQGLAMETELEQMSRNGDEKGANQAQSPKKGQPPEKAQSPEKARSPEKTAVVKEVEPAVPREDHRTRHEPSEPESPLVKVLRMQFGLLAGSARGMTEMAKMMENFLGSLADETDLDSSKAWRDRLENAPKSVITAMRKAMENGGEVSREILDAYRRHQAGKD